VDHEAQILLVDAEAERVGRDDGLELTIHELILRFSPFGCGHPSMIQPNLHVAVDFPEEVGVQSVGLLHGGSVDDSGAGSIA
jgi:hypothetical protein